MEDAMTSPAVALECERLAATAARLDALQSRLAAELRSARIVAGELDQVLACQLHTLSEFRA